MSPSPNSFVSCSFYAIWIDSGTIQDIVAVQKVFHLYIYIHHTVTHMHSTIVLDLPGELAKDNFVNGINFDSTQNIERKKKSF